MSISEGQFRKRSAILASLRQSTQHPSAEALFEYLRQEHKDISRATVYRNLAMFREQGQIISLGTVDGIERFDGNTTPHDHFVCTRCNCVQDLPRVPMVPEAVVGAADTLGCHIDGYRLMFTGICRNCLPEK